MRGCKQGDGLIQGQLLRRDGRMVTQMVHADFTFKFWSQMLGCVSLEGIFREVEIENTETDTTFSLSLALFPTSERKPGMLFSVIMVCIFWSHTKACVCCCFTTNSMWSGQGTPRICRFRMGQFQFHWEYLLRAEALEHWSYQTTSLWPCSPELTSSVCKHKLLICTLTFEAVLLLFPLLCFEMIGWVWYSDC